ncbi:MAG: hypothetical protein JXB32_12400 [Deltaproteobacteria bacterium]|nr:hypothetical protein [Deltaproteobacteria bacterium]
MHRLATLLGLLALLGTGCPPPPVGPADEPPPTEPTPDDPTTPTEPDDPDGTAEIPVADDPGTPDPQEAAPPDDPAEPVEPESGPAGSAARLLAAADCFPRAVAALQAEPRDGESLEAFLARGLEALRAEGPLPGSCGVLRPDGPAVPICAGGNPVRVERTEVSHDLFEGGRTDVHLRYRFDCGGDVTTATELTWSVGGE